MVWYFNFCEPAFPNDPSINSHRFFQALMLITLKLLSFIFYLYYHMCSKDIVLIEEIEEMQKEESSKEEKFPCKKNFQKKIDDFSSETNSTIQSKFAQTNSSRGVFVRPRREQIRMPFQKDEKKIKRFEVVENLSMRELEHYTPIILGHFFIAGALSIMYTPYVIQSIAMFLYFILTIILGLTRIKNKKNAGMVIWFVMCLISLYLLASGGVEIYQTSLDMPTKKCFNFEYTSFD